MKPRKRLSKTWTGILAALALLLFYLSKDNTFWILLPSLILIGLIQRVIRGLQRRRTRTRKHRLTQDLH